MSKKVRPLLFLIPDDCGRGGISDYNCQGLPDDFTWIILDINDEEGTLEKIKEFEPDITDPVLKKWIKGVKDTCLEILKAEKDRKRREARQQQQMREARVMTHEERRLVTDQEFLEELGDQ